jgi:membrane-bound transcription factor site-1 protease
LKNQNKLENVPFADQGSGVFNIENIHRSLIQDDPLMTYVHPETLDLTSVDYEPFSSLSFYSTMMPVSFNFTVIHPELGPPKIETIEWRTENEDIHDCLQLTFEWSQNLIPFYSLIRAKIGIKPSSRCQYAVAENETISATVKLSSNETVGFNIVLSLVPTPERGDRILIDSFHNLKFPEDGYILRDSIFIDKHPYEWKGDHMFTNYVHLYKFLRSQGYFVEILNEPITCFDARNYAALFMADGEKALSRNEIVKLRKDIETRNMGLVIIAEWSDEEMMQRHSFKSEFTGKTWDPIVGG